MAKLTSIVNSPSIKAASVVEDCKLAVPVAAAATMLVPNTAFAANASGALSGVLGGVSGIVITVIAIVGLIVVGKMVLEYVKGGQGSGGIGKILGAVGVIIVAIAFVIVFTNFGQGTGIDAFGNIATSAVGTAGEVASEVVGN